MKRLWFILTVLLMGSLPLRAQLVELVHGGGSGEGLFLDMGRTWSYNLYERSRWSTGLRWVAVPRWGGGDRLVADVYAGYGYYDHQWKGGGTLTVGFARSRHALAMHWSLAYDMLAAANHSLTAASLTDPGSLVSFTSRRMALASQGRLGMSWRAGRASHLVEGRADNGYLLYDSYYLLYGDDITTPYRDCSLRWLGRWDNGLSAEVQAGMNFDPYGKPYLRMLLQYARTLKAGPFDLSLFGQGGLTPPPLSAGYQHLFDLGGTQGAPLCFDRAMLTARPVEFTADAFVFGSVLLRLRNPLFKFYSNILALGSNPRPFVRVDAMAGALMGDYSTGAGGIAGLQAPDQGLAEAVAGIEGLVRWGVADIGVAAAYRMAPPQAPYNLGSPTDNLTLLVTASLHVQ